MKEYTLAFIFDLFGKRVLLIHKSSLSSPPNVFNKYNGIGGKLEFEEAPLDGIIREVKEETGLELSTFNNFATLTDEKYFKIHCFVTLTSKIFQYKQTTKEKLEIFNIKLLPKNIAPNLKYLIPMALTFEEDSADHLYIKELYL